ncbi:autonomous transposable element EN-1 mosaic protein isoform X5 [Oryza sativa Japonica Group]
MKLDLEVLSNFVGIIHMREMNGIDRKRLARQQQCRNISTRSNASATNAKNRVPEMINGGGSSNSGANSSQRLCAGNSSNTDNASQATNIAGSGMSSAPPNKRGRKKGSRTALKVPPRGRKIALKPRGDEQFEYVTYPLLKSDPKYGTHMGIILKREYPGIIEEKDENGVIISSRPATSWFDYYEKEDDSGVTKADKVKQEFWNAFCVSEADKVEADRVLENYAAKSVRQMMYQLCVDSVKVYHDKIGEEIDDALARPKELEVDEYKDGPVDWCRDNGFSYIADYWCTEEFKAKRKRGQQARLNSEDVAQNRGGSRPFTETQQYMGVKFGPEKATTLNTFSAMKTGFKNIDNDGNIGPIPSQKAQKHVTDYLTGLRAKYPDDWQQRDLDENVLYSTNGGLPHGRVQIANGAVRKANILAVAKSTNVRPANSIAFQNMARQNEQLLRENQYMRKKQERTDKLLLALYEKLGEQVPQELDCPVEEEDPFAQGTSSSRVVSQPVEDNGNNNSDGYNTASGNGGNNNSDNNCNGNNTSSLNANDGSNIGGNNNSGGCNTSTS